MNFSIFILFSVVIVVTAENHFLSDDFINKINKKQNTWTAGRNFDVNIPKSQIQNLFGVEIGKKSYLPTKSVKIVKNLPENFDAREQWPKCKSIKEIRDQSNCGSSWVVAAVSAMSDKICIGTNSTVQVSLSANDVLSCCSYCGLGCRGGVADNVWYYWKTSGIVSGGVYGSNKGCKSYPFPPCEHYTKGTLPPCGDTQKTLECNKKCDANSNLTYEDDLYFGKDTSFIIANEKLTKSEIFKNGSVEASFSVYEDFLSYKKGVYQHTEGDYIGYHAVKIIGWGVENNVPYWLAANSWNENWGDKGFFKILRGVNECGIEQNIQSGTVDLERLPKNAMYSISK